MDQGKLFIGGISWDTDEDRLKEYFGAYGQVVEAVIMRDRTTGRARGFGFVVYADPAVAERVVKEKHMIDGRTVEAKKAVPRDGQHLINRNTGSTQGSPGQGHTKKIFVGGLASRVTENDFKSYFDQFGTITDAVVMYDHNTQRPRGFGFITYDSEDAVDRVLFKTFHELNGKMVEVKRAVPKELSSGPSWSPLLGYNYEFSRPNNFQNSYTQGYDLSSLAGYGIRMDGRYNSLANSRAGFSHFGSPTFGMGVNMEQGLNTGFGGGSNFSGNLGYGRVMNPFFGSNQSRYNTPIGYNSSSSRGDYVFSSPSRNVWGNGSVNTSSNNASSGSCFGSGSDIFGVFGNNGANWGTSPNAASFSGNSSGYSGGNVGFGGGENSYPLGMGGFGRNGGTGVTTTSSFSASVSGYEGSYGDFYHGGSVYGDPTWQTTSFKLGNSGSFDYGIGNPEDGTTKDSNSYGVGYDILSRQPNRGRLQKQCKLCKTSYVSGHYELVGCNVLNLAPMCLCTSRRTHKFEVIQNFQL